MRTVHNKKHSEKARFLVTGHIQQKDRLVKFQLTNNNQIFLKENTDELYFKHLLVTDITTMTDHNFLRRMNILVLEGIEFMKEGMIRMKV